MTILACDLGGTRLKIDMVRDGCVLAHAVELAHSQQGLAPHRVVDTLSHMAIKITIRTFLFTKRPVNIEGGAAGRLRCRRRAQSVMYHHVHSLLARGAS